MINKTLFLPSSVIVICLSVSATYSMDEVQESCMKSSDAAHSMTHRHLSRPATSSLLEEKNPQEDRKLSAKPSKRISCNPLNWVPSWISTPIFQSVATYVTDPVAHLLGKPDVKLEYDPGLLFWAKRALWIKLASLFYGAPATIKSLTLPEDGPQEIVPWTTLGISLPAICTARQIPTSERLLKQRIGTSFVYYMDKLVSMDGYGPSIPRDPEALTKLCYPPQYQNLSPAPLLPAELTECPDDLVGVLALKGPFAGYIKAIDNDEYSIDLSFYANKEFGVKKGLAPLGAEAFCKYDSCLERMQTTHIHYLGHDYSPCHPKWNYAQKVMLATLCTHVTLVDHLLNTHLIISGTFSAVNNDTLPADHPLRRLMYPHQFKTLSTNNTRIKLLLGAEFSFVPNISSYDMGALSKITTQYCKDFDIETMNFPANLAKRGMENTTFPYFYRDNCHELWKIIDRYVGNYIAAYYPTDESLQENTFVQKWFKALDQYIPNGITKRADKVSPGYTPDISRENVQKLISVFIYTSSVEHAKAGGITFHYLPWKQFLPICVQLNNEEQLVDVGAQQEMMNKLFATTPPSIKLTDDLSYMALPEGEGRQCMQQFRYEMLRYQSYLDSKGEILPYMLCPRDIDVSVSS